MLCSDGIVVSLKRSHDETNFRRGKGKSPAALSNALQALQIEVAPNTHSFGMSVGNLLSISTHKEKVTYGTTSGTASDLKPLSQVARTTHSGAPRPVKCVEQREDLFEGSLVAHCTKHIVSLHILSCWRWKKKLYFNSVGLLF